MGKTPLDWIFPIKTAAPPKAQVTFPMGDHQKTAISPAVFSFCNGLRSLYLQ
ncbi:hypothetical protein [Paenibacillus macerans]|uniref:hypothetical protein n=1 Tax=Paenibacillus macerans TaxID=44252 RepID=UPI000AD2325D|nr:hypothetical protein [Paenibacillus macerans]